MSWSNETQQKLRDWLGAETSYKFHPIDDERFYEFIASVWREKRGIWDESQALEAMLREAKRLHSEWGEDLIQTFVEERLSQGTLILDFLTSIEESSNISALA